MSKIVVMIDNSPADLGIFGKLIRKAGFEFHGYESGQEFFDSNISPDFFLIDLSMPGMEGIELAETLIEQDEEACIAILTGQDVHDPELILIADDLEIERIFNKDEEYNGKGDLIPWLKEVG